MFKSIRENTLGPDRRSVALGLIVLGSLVWHGWVKYQRGVFIEMSWVCHVAALTLGLGLLIRQRVLVGVGFMFFAGAGMPLYLMDVLIFGAKTTPASFFEHVICPIAGFFEVWRSGIPRRAFFVAWLMAISLQLISLLFTPPELNINLAHKVWKPLADVFGNIWIYRGLNALVGLALLYGLWRVIDALMRKLNAPGWRPQANDQAPLDHPLAQDERLAASAQD